VALGMKINDETLETYRQTYEEAIKKYSLIKIQDLEMPTYKHLRETRGDKISTVFL
jgi:hypothetical protein